MNWNVFGRKGVGPNQGAIPKFFWRDKRNKNQKQ
jgi:hypothetical protein